MKDAIVILGSGASEDGTLPERAARRVDVGIELYKQGIAPRLIMSGAYAFWLDWKKAVPARTEASVMRDYAITHGVPAADILIEERSKDTLGNAYFVRMELLDVNGWRDVVVVTSEYHMERTRHIFELVLGPQFTMQFIEAASGYSEDKLRDLQVSEERTTKVLDILMGPFVPGDIEAVRNVLFVRHPGYAEHPEYSYERLRDMLGRDVRGDESSKIAAA